MSQYIWSSQRFVQFGLLFLVCVLFIPGRAAAVSFVPTVRTDGADATPGDGICATMLGTCTLRAAIEEANALAGFDSITVPPGTYRLQRALGELQITDDLQLNGGGATTTKIVGNKTYVVKPGHRVFEILAPATATLENIGLRGAGPTTGCGGGLRNGPGATVALINVDVSGNLSNSGGAGVCNDGGTMTMSNVTIERNRVFQSASGGGLYNIGDATLTDVTIRQNNALFGGGIYNAAGTLTLNRVTLTRNRANRGAGVWVGASTTQATITNATLSRNFAADRGGGLYNDGIANTTLTNVTVHNNAGLVGGGIGGTLTSIKNVIINYNRLPTDLTVSINCESSASVVSLGNNLDSGTTCMLMAAGDISNLDALLGPLSFHGGLTKTCALGPASPAFNAGDDAACPATDQRGLPRVGTCDIGSYEAQ